MIEETEEIAEETEEIAEGEDPCACITGMTEWLQANDDTKECRPCLLPPVIQWYHEELEERGLNDLAQELEAAVHEGDPLLIVKKFDAIKGTVPEDVKERLKEFDCAAQTYDGPTLEMESFQEGDTLLVRPGIDISDSNANTTSENNE